MSTDTVASSRATMSDSLRPTPADWYVDPADASLLRWWSGADWTEHTSPRGPQAALRPVKAAPASVSPTRRSEPDAPLSRRELRARAHALSESPADSSRPLTAAFALRDETGFVDVATTRTPVSVFTPLWPTRVHTFAVWLIAVIPLGWAVAEHASGLLVAGADLATIRIAVTAAFLVITLLCAFRDGHLLRLGGHSDTATAWWVLLSPLAYLIARTVRVRQETKVRAPAAVWVWLIATLPMIALLTGVRGVEDLLPSL